MTETQISASKVFFYLSFLTLLCTEALGASHASDEAKERAIGATGAVRPMESVIYIPTSHALRERAQTRKLLTTNQAERWLGEYKRYSPYTSFYPRETELESFEGWKVWLVGEPESYKKCCDGNNHTLTFPPEACLPGMQRFYRKTLTLKYHPTSYRDRVCDGQWVLSAEFNVLISVVDSYVGVRCPERKRNLVLENTITLSRFVPNPDKSSPNFWYLESLPAGYKRFSPGEIKQETQDSTLTALSLTNCATGDIAVTFGNAEPTQPVVY